VRAVLVRAPGGPEQLELGEFPTPTPADGELLVRVRAAGVNHADLLQREGRYPPPPGASPILGLEVAGVVEVGGPRTATTRAGDRVFGLLPGGGYAEYAVLPAAMAMPVPDGLSFEEAAAVPEVFLTGYQCLVWLGGLQPDAADRSAGPAADDEDEWRPRDVLVHAGASGVGTAAIQLVRDAGARAIVTAGSERKLEACRHLGAAFAFNYREGPFGPKVREATGGRGVDLVLDLVGAPYWEQNVACLAVDGRLVLVATMGGARVEGLDLAGLMRKRAWVIGTTLRVRSSGYKVRLTRAFASYGLPRFADGRLRPVVDRVFDWSEAAAAHRYMEENRNVGKIVLGGM
jgi:putative PIG3 family NAD(P)H quinone oxidoreductase